MAGKMRILLFLLLAVNAFAQYGGDGGYGMFGRGNPFGYSTAVPKPFSAIDFNGANEYLSRTYSASDSLLNMNGYERVQLPQSTMKVAFTTTSYDAAQTFTADSGYWRAYSSTASIVGGKYRVTMGNGIKTAQSYASGSLIYIKYKVRLVSGTSVNLYTSNGTDVGTSSNNIIFAPTSEEKTFEGTFIMKGSSAIFVGYAGAPALGNIYEYDDIEVREVTNSVTNGTFITSDGWDFGTNVYRDDALNKVRGTSVPDGINAVRRASGLALRKGKRYIITYQCDTLSAGGLYVSAGGTTGTIRTSAGVYSDTLTSLAFPNDYLIFKTSGTTSFTLNNVHCYEIPSYTYTSANSNHKVGWSKIDALTGAGDTTSLKIISTDAGDSVTNHIKIVSGANTFHSFVNGNKYTIEAWARGTGVRGTNLIPDSAAYFNPPYGGVTYWQIAVAGTVTRTWSSTDSSMLLVPTGTTSYCIVNANWTYVAGKIYRVTFRAKADSNRTYGIDYLGNNTGIASSRYLVVNPNLTTSWQNYSCYHVGNASNLGVQLGVAKTGITPDDSVFIDNVVIQEVTRPTLTLAVQGQTKTSDTLSVIPGVFEKVVWNFTANATPSADTLKFYVNQADTVYIDSVNISQAYDFVIEGWFYNKVASTQTYIDKTTGLGTFASKGIGFFRTASGFYFDHLSLSSNTGIELSRGSAPTLNAWEYICIRVKRTDSVSMWVNGVLASTNSTYGSITGNANGNDLRVGASNLGTFYYNGYIGELRWTKFSNISSSNWTTSTPLATYNAYRRGRGFQDNLSGGGKQTVVWYKWSDGSTTPLMLQDYSGNGYTLTGNNVDTGDRVKWRR